MGRLSNLAALFHRNVSWLVRRKHRVRILRAAEETIYAVMQMIRCPFRIAGVSNVPQHGSGLHKGSRLNIAKAIEVSIVMPLPTRAEDSNYVAAEVVFTNFEDYTVRCAENRSTERCEDVDTFMTSIAAARSAPGVSEFA